MLFPTDFPGEPFGGIAEALNQAFQFALVSTVFSFVVIVFYLFVRNVGMRRPIYPMYFIVFGAMFSWASSPFFIFFLILSDSQLFGSGLKFLYWLIILVLVTNLALLVKNVIENNLDKWFAALLAATFIYNLFLGIKYIYFLKSAGIVISLF